MIVTEPKRVSSVNKVKLDEYYEAPTLLKQRSQSMSNISYSQIETSGTGFLKGTRDHDSAESRMLALKNMIEQRRRGFSKLKGLVIPEKTAEANEMMVVDLSEIKTTNANLPSK